jgi:transposase InsO family protein
MEDDDEVTFRLKPATEPRYNLRYTQRHLGTTLRTSSDGEVESGTRKLSRGYLLTGAQHDGRDNDSLEAELRRVTEHIEGLKRHLSSKSDSAGRLVTAAHSLHPSGSLKQPSGLGAACSKEPSEGHSGSLEQLGHYEPTRSSEPFVPSSGSAEQPCSNISAFPAEPSCCTSRSELASGSLDRPEMQKSSSNKIAERASKQGRESFQGTLPFSDHQSSRSACGGRTEVEKPPAIRLDKYNGKSCLDTYLAKFKYISDHFEWDETQQLLYLRTHLEGAAGELLWSHPELDTFDSVVKLLQNRFGTENQRERFRVELRTRRRKQGEDIQSLYQDIVRLMSLAYPNERSEAADVVARDAFLEALDDPTLHFRILDRDPKTIEDALKIAIRTEAYEKAVDPLGTYDGKSRKGKGAVRMVEQVSESLEQKSESVLGQIMSSLSELKADNVKLRTELELALKRDGSSEKEVFETHDKKAHRNQRKLVHQKDKDSCHRCGKLGHWARQCTHGKAESAKSVQSDVPKTEAKVLVTGVAAVGDETYITIKVGDHDRCALLDTGCSRSCIARKFVPRVQLDSPDEQLYAANGTRINNLGAFTLHFKIGNINAEARLQVSDQLDEMILGYDWLRRNQCYWDFDARTLIIDGQKFCLFSRPERRFIRRVYVKETVTIEPNSQMVVPVSLALHSVRTPIADWMVDSSKLSEGLYSARTVLSGQESRSGILIANVSSRPKLLAEGTLVGQSTVVEELETECYGREGQEDEDPFAHVQSLIERIPSDLTVEERQEVERFIRKHANAFSVSDYDIGRTKLIPHRIDTGSNRPVRQQLRRHPQSHLEIIDQEVKKMLDHDIIEESASPWSSNVVLVAKKNGKLRFCIDYRKLNSITYKDSYPIPKIDSCLDTLAGARFFSTLDLRSGYWQVEIEKSDRDKTAFVTRMGQFRFKVLSFGLTNAVSVFQRLMDKVLSGLNWFICLCYLDDVCVFSNSFEEHLKRLSQVIERIEAAGLKFNPEKCSLFQKRIKFLGHEVSEKGVQPDAEKVDVILSWPIPRNLTELRSWLGLIGYYRKWVIGFSAKAKPLFELARKGVTFRWSDCQQRSFDELKRCLTTAPILGLPNDNDGFVLDTDCSESAAGAVLSQQQGPELRVVAYASRTLRGPELNYSTTRKELTAVVFGLKQFRQYLIGRHFLLRTDHAALTGLLRTPEPVGQQARYLDFISQFHFDIEHRPGKCHGNCDSLSRRPQGNSYPESQAEEETSDESRICVITATSDDCWKDDVELFYEDLFLNPENNVELPTNEPEIPDVLHDTALMRIEPRNFINDEEVEALSVENIAKQQHSDPDLAYIIQAKERGLTPPPLDELVTKSDDVRRICAQWESLVYADGLLYRLFEDVQKNTVILQLIVPRELQRSYVRQCHIGMTGGHQGVRKTEQQVARRAYFPSWKNEVAEVCRNCEECLRYHRGKPPRQGLLQVQEVACVMDKLAVDLTGPHPTSSKGYVYILTAIDVFSRFLVAVPLRSKTAETVADILYREVFCRFGTARQLVTDQGREFDNELLSCLCNLFGIKKMRTSAYHPSANGRVERCHRTLNSIIAKVVAENQKNWHEVLDFAVAAYNASPNESTKYSPNYLMFGREVLTPFDLIATKSPTPTDCTMDKYVTRLQEMMEKVYAVVRNNTHVAARQRKKIYDATVKPTEFSPGKFVWVYQPRSWRRRSPKWSSYYIGPCLVERRINAVTYVLKRSPGGRSFVVHVDKLKSYSGNLSDGWLKYLRNKQDVSGGQEGQSKDTASDVSIRINSGELHCSNELAGSEGAVAPGQLAGLQEPAAADELAGPNTTVVASDRSVVTDAATRPDPCTLYEDVLSRPVAEGDVNNTGRSRPRRGRRPPRWQKDYICGINKVKNSLRETEMADEQEFTCNVRRGDGQKCGRVFKTDSGIRRHSLTVHGRRYHADRSPSPLGDVEFQQRVAVVRGRQQNSKTRKRNLRRRTKRALAAYENGVAGVVSTRPGPSTSVAAEGDGTVISTVDDLVEDWFANPGNLDVQAEVDGEDWVALLQDFDGVMGADEVSATTDGRFHQLSPLQIGSTTDESTTGSTTTDVGMVPAVGVESTTGSSTTDVAMVPAVGVESATGSSTTDMATAPAVGMRSISSSPTVDMATGTESATGTQLMESVGVATDEVPVRSVGVGDRYVDDDDVVRGYNGPLRCLGK